MILMRLLVAALFVHAITAAAQVTPAQAVTDARTVPVPTAPSLISPAKGAEVVPQWGADTQPQRDLFSGGKGNLVIPGTSRTTDCMSKNDPECVAVQLIVTGRGTRPVMNIPTDDPMLQFRDNIVKDPKAILGNDPPIVETPESCSNVIKTIKPTYTTEVCDITIPASDVRCLQGLEIIVDPDYVYSCIQRLASDEASTCSVGREIVVDANTLYKCIEQIQTTSAAACTVGRTVTIDADYNYQCDVRPYKVNQYQCTRQLVITPIQGPPTCSAGTWVISQPRGTNLFWSGSWNKLIHTEFGFLCEPDRADGALSIWFGAFTDGDLVGETATAVVPIANPYPPAGQLPLYVGTVFTKYSIGVNVYFTTPGCPTRGQSCQVTVYFFPSAFNPEFNVNLGCPSGGIPGDRIRDEFWVPLAPYTCYTYESGIGHQLIDTGEWISITGSYPGTVYSWAPRGNDVGTLTLTVLRPGYTQAFDEHWTNGCAALEARQ